MRAVIFNTLIICGLLLFCSSCANPQKQEKGGAKEKIPLEKKTCGKIVFDKEIHNFGTLKDGEIVSYSFTFRNMGGSPFKISKVEKTCGCIDFKYDFDAIEPGENSVIEVIFNTSGEWGNQFKGATVETSEGERVELQIGAFIENKQFNNL